MSDDPVPDCKECRSAPPVWMRVSACFALVVGAALRLCFYRWFPQIQGDAEVYGDLAKNLVLHGQLALSDPSGQIHASLIRLPGYPLFMALCFRLFGMENFWAVVAMQTALDAFACLLMADTARRIAQAITQRRTGRMEACWGTAILTLWLAELCPFTAIYVSAPLTEGPTLFCIALAMWSALRFQDSPRGASGWRYALLFTFAVAWAALLRPDGALLAIAFAPALLTNRTRQALGAARLARMGAVCALLALAPFALWTGRNARVFHVFEPLAPRYASDPGDSSDLGFEHWAATWTLDFVNTVEVYWPVPGASVEIRFVPQRAWSNPHDDDRLRQILLAYNEGGYQTTDSMNHALDTIAARNLAAHPWRCRLAIPLGRVADMWLRPRVENLPIDLDWWVYAHHHYETIFSWSYAALNLIFLGVGFAGWALKPRLWLAMALYILLRSLLLATVEGPEARYTIEFFPMLIVCGGVWLGLHLPRAKQTRNQR